MSELLQDKKGNAVPAMTWPASSTEYLSVTAGSSVRTAAVPDDVKLVTVSTDFPVYFETGAASVECATPAIPGVGQPAQLPEGCSVDIALPNRRANPFHIAFRAASTTATVVVSYRGV